VVLERDPGRHDVRVVAGGHGDERVGVLDAGLLEDLAVEAESDELLRALAWGVPPEGVRVLVDHRDVVAALEERVRELRSDTTATHDEDVHGAEGYYLPRRHPWKVLRPTAGGSCRPRRRARRKVVGCSFRRANRLRV